jgi:hypothetical protein
MNRFPLKPFFPPFIKIILEKLSQTAIFEAKIQIEHLKSTNF